MAPVVDLSVSAERQALRVSRPAAVVAASVLPPSAPVVSVLLVLVPSISAPPLSVRPAEPQVSLVQPVFQAADYLFVLLPR